MSDQSMRYQSEDTVTPPPERDVRIGDVWSGPGFHFTRSAQGWEPTFPAPIPAPTHTPRIVVTPGDVIDPRAGRRAAVGTVARHGLIILGAIAVGFAIGFAIGGLLS